MNRRFFIDAIILLVFTLGALFFFDNLFKETKNNYDFLFQELQEKSLKITRLNIGNSHIGALMNYGNDSATCFNASAGGQDIFHTCAVLRKFIPSAPNLKTIIFGLDYDLLGYDFLIANEIWKDRQYYQYTTTLYDNSLINHFLARSSFFRNNRDFNLLWLQKTGTQNKMNFTPITNGKENDCDCEDRAREHSEIKFNPDLIPINIRNIIDIIFLCKKHNIKIIFLNTPKKASYCQSYNKRTIELTKNFLKYLNISSKIRFIDLFNNPTFNDEDFIDCDHLNETGAKKLIYLYVLPVL